MDGKTILLVEDNPNVMRNNTTALQSRGAEVLAAAGLAEARRRLSFLSAENSETSAWREPDAAVIDIMLPDGSGLDLLREIRGRSGLPVLLLTAKDTPRDIVAGLSLGADDYLSKPYDLNVFAARIEALLRRARTVGTSIDIGRLRFDLISNRAFCGGRDLLLTRKEFALLLLLARHEGKTLSAKCLFEKVWGQQLTQDTSALKVQMSNLKKKLSGEDILIETSRGEGYGLNFF